MRIVATLVLAAALAAPMPRVAAHDRDHAAAQVDGNSMNGANEVEASTTVRGTVGELKGQLYRVDRWPALFSDVRSAQRKPGGTWSIDFERFGHAHDFHVRRAQTGIVIELAVENHGQGRLEYTLEPVNATHSRLALRFLASTPPGFSDEQMLGTLRTKALTDLQDFSSKTRTKNEGSSR